MKLAESLTISYEYNRLRARVIDISDEMHAYSNEESAIARVKLADDIISACEDVIRRAKYAAVWEMTRPQNSEDKGMAERAAKQLGVSTAEVRRMIGEFNKMRGNDG